MKIPSNKELAALTFPPSEFQYLLGKTPFRRMLDALEHNFELYEDLCEVGQLLLNKRQLRPPRRARRLLNELLVPHQSLEADTRELCKRAKKNIRVGRALVAKTDLLLQQKEGITGRTYLKRKELGAALRELVPPAAEPI